jgi:hypothetical protein
VSKDWPQEHELRAMPLLERIEHARRAALVEDKESIELLVGRYQKAQEVLEFYANDMGNGQNALDLLNQWEAEDELRGK